MTTHQRSCRMDDRGRHYPVVRLIVRSAVRLASTSRSRSYDQSHSGRIHMTAMADRKNGMVLNWLTFEGGFWQNLAISFEVHPRSANLTLVHFILTCLHCGTAFRGSIFWTPCRLRSSSVSALSELTLYMWIDSSKDIFENLLPV